MADTKITALTAIGANPIIPSTFPIPMVDLTDTSMAASGTTKKVTVNQILGAGGTATLASATISGALTVGTGANAAVLKASFLGGYSVFENSAGTGNPSITFNNDLDTGIRAPSANTLVFDAGGFEQYRIASSGVFTWSDGAGGTRMTLNATGLGVGVASPAAKVHVVGGAAQNPLILDSTGYNHCVLKVSGTNRGQFYADATNCFAVVNSAGSATPFVVTDTGNVGIGVQPSAWASGLKALQGANTGSYWFGGGTAWSANNYNYFGNNGYNDGSNWLYTRAYGAAQYEQYDNEHRWKVSTNSPSAGGAITFSQAMTLDASGNLLVGKTAIGTTVGVEVRPDGYIIATRSASTDAAAFTNAVYSTGASAYRFYVGLGGTVYATNTTISAISDARLKENVQDIDVGLGAILALKPRKFDWKAGKGKDIKGDRGFIAQEFEQVFPQLVDEWADPAPEGESPYKSVRQDLIPVLVKAIQELAAEVNALKNA